MSHFTEDEFDSIAELRHLVPAAAAVARLDEAVVHMKRAQAVYVAPTIRNEARSAAALEGNPVRSESLCRLLGNRESSNLDRAVRLAADIHDALGRIATWSVEAPPAEEVRKVFDIADGSSGRRMKQDLEWSLEEDCSWLNNELLGFCERPDPWEAMETLRVLWSSNRFLGTSRRMTLLVSGWVLARGFGCAASITGLATVVSREVDMFRDGAQSKLAWMSAVSQALFRISEDGKARIESGKATFNTMMALCPPQKESSSVERAIEYMMVNPVFTARAFAEGLDLTPRGAKVVLDKLEEADLVEVDGGLRNRNFVCRRAL